MAMWQAAVSTSHLPMGLVELSTTRILGLSRSAAELLGVTPEEGLGLDYRAVAEGPEEAAEAFRLVQEGLLDGVRGRRWFRRPDGSTIEVETAGWAIRSRHGPDLGLWVARDPRATHSDGSGVAAPTLTVSAPGPATLDLVGARVTLDDRWQLSRVSTSTGLLLGQPAAELRATSIIELTHTDDRLALLSAFARATSVTGVGVRVRLCHKDGSWRTTHAAPTVLESDGTSVFAVDLAIDEEGTGPSNELGRLAGHLRRIAAQIESAGVLVETGDPLGLPIMTDLSARQWEVVSRLVRGERVATIAAEMFLSQSTVRNHLSAIFRKVGVHSQQELLALWRGASRAP